MKVSPRLAGLILAAPVLLAASTQDMRAQMTALTHVRVIDGTGRAPLEDASTKGIK